MCFDVIARSKCYSLFPILSSLIEPSLRSFRISLSNGLFSSVGIGKLGKVFFPQNRTWEFPTSYGSIHYSLVLYQNFQRIGDDSLGVHINQRTKKSQWHEFLISLPINSMIRFYLFSYPQKDEVYLFLYFRLIVQIKVFLQGNYLSSV